MKGNIGARIAEWRRLTRGNSFEATETFLNNNKDLLGCLDEIADAEVISRHGSLENACALSIEKIQKFIKLVTFGIPKKIAKLITKNPDFVDLPLNQVIEHYRYLVNRDVSEAASAIISSTYYPNKELRMLEEVADSYHITKSSEIPLELPYYIARYRKLFKTIDEDELREVYLAFHIIEGLLNGEYNEEEI